MNATGGSLPQLADVYNKQNGWFTRSNSWKYSLTWFLFFVFLFAPLLAIAGVDALPELAALFGFFGGLLILVFPFIFLKKEPQTWNVEQLSTSQKAREYDALHGKTNQIALPPQESVPTSTYVPPMKSWKAPDTSGLVHLGSVAVGTTKLMERDK